MDKEIIERVREDVGKLISDCVNRQSFTIQDLDKILSIKNLAIIDPTKQAIIDLESLRKLTEGQKE